MVNDYTDHDQDAALCASYDPTLADQPLPPAQPWERPDWQRTAADMPPLVRLPSPPSSNAAVITPLPAVPRAGGHWRALYQAELAALSLYELVQEQQKQQRMLAKAASESLPWLPKARARLQLVQTALTDRTGQGTFAWAA